MEKGVMPRHGPKKNSNQKSGSVKTFSIVELVYMEVFISFDEERESDSKDKQPNKQTNKPTNIETYNID